MFFAKIKGNVCKRSFLLDDGIVLQGVVAFFAGPDLDGVVDGRHEDLAVAVIARIEHFLRRFDDGPRRHFGNDHFDADLGQELGRHFGAAVEFSPSLFDAEAQGAGDGHARDADGFHSVFQGFKALFIGNDSHVIQGMAADWLGTGHDRIGNSLVQGDFLSPFRRFPGLQGLRQVLQIVAAVQFVSRYQAVFLEVQAVDFFSCRDAQAYRRLEDAENQGHSDEDEQGHSHDAGQLDQEQTDFSRIEQAVLDAEQARQEGPQGTAAAVSGNSPDRVVDAQFLVDEFDEEDRHDAGQGADDKGPRHADDITAGRNGHQRRQAAVESHGYVGLAIADPCRHHGRRRPGSGGDIGRKEDRRGL